MLNNLNVFLKTLCKKGLGGIQPSEQDGTRLKHSKGRLHPENVCQFSSTRTSRTPQPKKIFQLCGKLSFISVILKYGCASQ